MSRLAAWWKVSFSLNEKVILLSVLTICVLRFISIGVMGLMPQDAYYYYVYGKHLSLSYYDHPPLIGYLLRAFTEVFGKTVFAIKLADTVVTIATVISFYQLSRCFLSAHRARRSVLLLFSTFMVTILSLVSTPDVPLMLFWSLSLTALYYAIFLNRNIYWLWAGLAMGLAFDSKYTAVLLPVGLVLFLMLSAAYRKKLLSGGFWVSLVIFVLISLPVMIWNVQNSFASLRFQSEERMESMHGLRFSPLNLAGLVGHQSAILTPILLFALLLFSIKTLRRFSRKRILSAGTLFLFCFFVPAFLGFACISMFYWVKLNWLMPSYITGIILTAKYLSQKWIKVQVVFSLVIHVALAVEIFFYPVPVRSDDTWFGWSTLAKDVNLLQKSNPAAFVFAEDDTKTSSVLNFYSDSMVYSQNVIGENALHFDYIGPDLLQLGGKNAYFLNSVPDFKTEGKEHKFPEKLKPYFDSITEMNPILIKNQHKTMRKFLVYYCTNYHPGKLHNFARNIPLKR